MKQTLLRVGAKRSLTLSETTSSRLKGCEVVSTGLFHISSTENVLEHNGNWLLVLGSPLPAIKEVPVSWQDAAERLIESEGVFAALFWDNKTQKLVVCTDILGLQPLYFKKNSDEIVFSDKSSAFLGAANPAGWGAFLALGYTLGQDTLTEDVFRVEPASLLIIDAKDLSVEHRRYWSFDHTQPEATTSELYQALQQSVDLALDAFNDKDHRILMSGGYDSRLIAYLLSSRKIGLQATIVSHYDENLDADARFAKAITKHLEIPCSVQVPDHNFFSSKKYLDYLEASDAEIPSLYLFISQVSQFVSNEVIWEGLLPGKTLKASEVSFEKFQENNMKCFEHSIWRSAELVFGLESVKDMWLSFEQRWHGEIAKFPNTGKGTTLFNLAHRARNRVGINPFKVYQQHAKVLMPGMTRKYIQAAMSISHERKQGHKLYKEIFATYFPTALSFPIAHGSSIDMMQSKKLLSYLFLATVKVTEKLKHYPSILKMLPFKPPKGFARSELLHSSALLLTSEGIEQDFLTALADKRHSQEQALQLLFYWQVWQWLRQKPLVSILK